MRWSGGIALATCAVSTGSCIDLGSRSCTAIALVCEQTTVTLQSPNDAWTAGTYTLAIVVDGFSQQCTIEVPDPPSAAQGTCLAPGTTLSLSPIRPIPPAVCNAGTCSESASSADCLAGRFTMALTFGSPRGFEVPDAHVVGQLGLNLSVDGNELMSETIAPKATTTGSAACGFCTNASATLSIGGG